MILSLLSETKMAQKGQTHPSSLAGVPERLCECTSSPADVLQPEKDVDRNLTEPDTAAVQQTERKRKQTGVIDGKEDRHHVGEV